MIQAFPDANLVKNFEYMPFIHKLSLTLFDFCKKAI